MRASLCGVALVTLVAGCANPASDTPFIAPSRIIAVSGDLTFGQVMVGQSLQLQTLLISNAGTTALGITSLTFPCSSMFGATPLPLTIHANGTSGVGVTFSPTAVQDCSGQVQVNGNQMSGKNTIAVTASGVSTDTPIFSTSGVGSAAFDLPPYVLNVRMVFTYAGDTATGDVVTSPCPVRINCSILGPPVAGDDGIWLGTASPYGTTTEGTYPTGHRPRVTLTFSRDVAWTLTEAR